MVSAHQASINKDAAAKAPPPCTSSKTNQAKPLEAPKRTSLKEPISHSSSTKMQIAVKAKQAPPQSSLKESSQPMDIEQAQTPNLSLTSTGNPPVTGTDSSLMVASSVDTLESSKNTATLTTTVNSSPPPSPHQQQQQTALLMQTTPPHHNRSPATRKNKLYFNLHITPTPLPTGAKATATMKLEAYHQSFLKVINALIPVDKSLTFWPFEEVNALESTLLKTPMALGSSINQIIKFFDSFWIRKTFSLRMSTV